MAPKKQIERKPIMPKQKAILEWITEQIRLNGVSPSTQEISREFSISNGTVSHHVTSLVDKGWLKRDPDKHRSIEVVEVLS